MKSKKNILGLLAIIYFLSVGTVWGATTNSTIEISTFSYTQKITSDTKGTIKIKYDTNKNTSSSNTIKLKPVCSDEDIQLKNDYTELKCNELITLNKYSDSYDIDYKKVKDESPEISFELFLYSSSVLIQNAYIDVFEVGEETVSDDNDDDTKTKNSKDYSGGSSDDDDDDDYSYNSKKRYYSGGDDDDDDDYSYNSKKRDYSGTSSVNSYGTGENTTKTSTTKEKDLSNSEILDLIANLFGKNSDEYKTIQILIQVGIIK